MEIEKIITRVVDCGFRVHRDLGPGLLESVYEAVLANSLEQAGLNVERQVAVSFHFDGQYFEPGFRADLIVEKSVLVELKALEITAPVHKRQVLTYLRLLKMPVGLLINFGAATFKEGIQRVVNNHRPSSGSPLRIHNEI